MLALVPGVSPSEEVSECLKKCIGPLAKLDRSFHYVFNHYEEVLVWAIYIRIRYFTKHQLIPEEVWSRFQLLIHARC